MSKHRLIRGRIAVACLALSAGLPAVLLTATPAVAQTENAEVMTAQVASAAIAFSIPAQNLNAALIEFGRQSGQELLYDVQDTDGKTSTAVDGTHTRAEAMRKLLGGTGLEFEFTESGGMVVDDPEALGARRALRASSALAPVEAAAPVEPERTTTSSVQSARQGGIEEIIVTGQKREERIQDVPIAISAFSMDQLDNQKIEGGFDLLKAVPNVTFSKTNFSGYNFQIRGIGTQAVSATTDPGVAVSFNNTTLIVNRLFEQEYLDIERVEVLRGPQGTLYGRNATAGVINVISAKPKMGVYEGELKVETGNFDAQRLRGHYNFALNDSGTLAGRVAYASTVRDGYGHNQFDGSDIDNRDLWSGRLSLGWQPHERLRVNALWERFRENDQRVRSIKQLCHRDPGLDSVQGFDLTQLTTIYSLTGHTMQRIYQDQLSQGCLPGSLYAEGAFGVPNGLALPFVAAGRLAPTVGTYGNNPFARPENQASAPCEHYKTATALGFINLCDDDPYRGKTQSRNLRSIHSEIKPIYRAESDIREVSVDYDLSDQLLLSSQTVYLEDSVRSTQDLNRFETAAGFFNDSKLACAGGTWTTCDAGQWAGGLVADTSPGGIMCDPQLGCSDRFRSLDLSRSVSTQFNQEVRIVSSFDGPLNYSLGANYTRFETLTDYFVFSNTLTALAGLNPFQGNFGTWITSIACRPPGTPLGVVITCLQVDDQPLEDLLNGAEPYGHNYFLSRNPYELKSMAAFGELYYDVTDRLKLTAGVRVTWDQKTFTPVPSQTLLVDYREGSEATEHPSLCHGANVFNLCARMGTGRHGGGYPAEPDITQSWLEPTGRLGFDWKPELDSSWIDESLLYAFYTRGYKAGGANPPGVANPSGAFLERSQGAESPRVFKPEFVNAIEIGSKNRLFGGLMTVNANAFLYDYQDYQVSKIVNRSANNENFDAKVWGAELELLLAPTTDTVLNASIGFLKTRIADGEQSINLMDRSQGGGEMFVTRQQNPAFDPTLPARAEADYVAGLNAPADQEFLAYDKWVVVKPSLLQTSNCVVPADLVVALMQANGPAGVGTPADFANFCPGGTIVGHSYVGDVIPGTNGLHFNPMTDAPNGTAGFFADLGGNHLPNAPSFTVSLGAQQTFYLPGGWDITARTDWYWQDKSYARVYNTEYDRLKAWSSTSLSLWVSKPDWGLKVETYVKNVFDETPITGAYLGSDDTGLTTNVFTLDPRLIGVSITKQF